MYCEPYHFKSAVYYKSASLEINEWGKGSFLGTNLQAEINYNVVCNINEHQIAIGAKIFGERDGLVDK